ncbi:TPA: ABC transporter ATP-binding protein [Streptococcus pyogenes]|nr:ABC transporter ATP-binding protein [Streptococcus pyogenes]
MIDIENISKKYSKKGRFVLKDVSFSINNPGIYGLLGENGAGKTTLMNIIATVLRPERGSIYYKGTEIYSKNYNDYKKKVGYMPQDINLYGDLTVSENLKLFLILCNYPKNKIDSRIIELLNLINLYKQKDRKFKELSGGMKRRLGLGICLCKDPEIIIVDEPTTGVDPVERISIRNILKDLAINKIIIFSSHIIEDIEFCCDTVSILSEGKLIYSGDIRELINSMKNKVWLVKKDDKINENNYLITNITNYGKLRLYRVISSIKPVEDAEAVEPTLEDAFIYLRKDKIIR